MNTTLQLGTPYIHKLWEVYLDLLVELYCWFLKPSVVKNKDIISIIIELKNQKDNSDLVIGQNTVEIVEKLNNILKKKKTFYKNVLNFYIVAYNCIINKFSINDETLKNAEVTDLSKLELLNLALLYTLLIYFQAYWMKWQKKVKLWIKTK